MAVNPETLAKAVRTVKQVQDAAKAEAAKIAKERAQAETQLPLEPLPPSVPVSEGG